MTKSRYLQRFFVGKFGRAYPLGHPVKGGRNKYDIAGRENCVVFETVFGGRFPLLGAPPTSDRILGGGLTLPISGRVDYVFGFCS